MTIACTGDTGPLANGRDANQEPFSRSPKLCIPGASLGLIGIAASQQRFAAISHVDRPTTGRPPGAILGEHMTTQEIIDAVIKRLDGEGR